MQDGPDSRPPRAWLDGQGIHAETAGRTWLLRRPDDLESLWARMGEDDFGEDERLPYWTELWPSSLALSEWLRLRLGDIAGRHCLDLGCGLGLTAMTGQWLGARMTAFDYEPQALAFCRENAALNRVAQPAWLLMDWRRPAVARHVFWRIWGADVLYERRFMEPVADFLEWALAPGGAAWFAEPGRKVFGGFLAELEGRGWLTRKMRAWKIAAVHPQEALIEASVWEARKARE